MLVSMVTSIRQETVGAIQSFTDEVTNNSRHMILQREDNIKCYT